jgi:membrane protein
MARRGILEVVPETPNPTPATEEQYSDAPGSVTRAPSAGQARTRWVRARYEGSVVQEFVRTLSKVDFGTEVILFGSAILLSVVPIIILLSSLASTRIDDDVARNMGLDRRGAQYMARLFTTPHSATGSEVVIGLLMAVAGTIAAGLSVQVVYEKIFDHDHQKGIRNLVRCIVWVACVGALLVVDAMTYKRIERPVIGTVLEPIIEITALTLFFWWSMHFLLAGRRSWRQLRAPAVATTLYWIAFGIFASLYFSGSIDTDARLYGSIGIVFDLATWFIAVGAVIILGAATGATWQNVRRR